ncbi:MAG: 50S ribosomal protein L29 [Patescibacteria group bacterium]
MSELKNKSVEDLKKALDEKREEIRGIRFDLAGTTKKNVKATLLARREVARISTEITARKATNK